MAFSKVTLNGDTLMDVTQKTVTAASMLSGVTALKNDGTGITGTIASKSSSDLTVSGATVTAPAGYYASSASKSVATGTATTPATTITANPSMTATINSGKNLFDMDCLLEADGWVEDNGDYYGQIRRVLEEYPIDTGVPIYGGLKENTQYTVSLTVRIDSEEGTNNGLTVVAYYSDGTHANVCGALRNQTTWTRISGTTTSGKTVTEICIGYSNGGVNVWHIKEAQIEEGSTLTDYTPYAIQANVSASVSASQSVTPTVSAGYVSTGTAGTVSVSGSGSETVLLSDMVSGTKTITENATGIDVAEYAAVDVVVEKNLWRITNIGTDTETGTTGASNQCSIENAISTPLSNLKLFGTAKSDLSDISGADGYANVISAGKNLLPYENGAVYVSGTYERSIVPQPDGGLKITGTIGAGSIVGYPFHINIHKLNIPQGSYKLSLTGSGTGFDSLAIQIYSDINDGSGLKSRWYGNTSYNFTIGSAVIEDYIRIRIPGGDNGTTYDCTVYPMLTFSTEEDASFSPSATTYRVPITSPGLLGIPVSSGGNVTDSSNQQWISDTIDLVNGTYTQRVGKVTFDGTETWTESGSTSMQDSSKRRYYTSVLSNVITKPSNNETAVLMCDRYSVLSFNGDGGLYYGNEGVAITATGMVTIYDSTYGVTPETGFTEWKATLATNPINILYTLDTPVVTNLTDAQLAVLRSITPKEGNGTIYTTGLSRPLMSMRYYQSMISETTQSTSPKDVNFIDYDGTILYSYTKSEFVQLTALPANPNHSSDDIPLTSQGWNWTLAQINAQLTAQPNDKVYVGQMYVTTDGKTYIEIELHDGRLSPYLGIAVNGTVVVDWGDNTATSTVTGSSLTSQISTPHGYAAAGRYTISISVSSGSFAFYGTTTYFLLNKNSSTGNENRVYSNAVQSVRIGNNASIGNYAFNFCYSLASITIPSGVTSIGSYAFQYCYSLASITIPIEVLSIGSSTFYYCYSLASIAIPSGATSISGSVFGYCYSLASLTIPSGVTSINNNTFYYCYSLASLTIPSGVTSIGGSAFYYCVSLASLTIPSGVTSIGNSAFNYCTGLAKLRFLPTTPPTVANSNAFTNIPTDCVISVPTGKKSDYTGATNYPDSGTYTYIEE